MTVYPRAAMERSMRVQEVILKALSGEIHWFQAADILGMSPRSVRRWRERYEQHGYTGLLDRRRGRPSPRRAPLAEVERMLKLYRERYSGFNGRHFHEIVRREHGVRLSYSFVKKALQVAGYLPKKRSRGRHRKRREPKASFGEMLHLDGSPHAWLALVPEKRQVLMSVVDDATGQILYGELVDAETTRAVMVAMREVIRTYGLPMAWYTDRAGWAVHTPRAGGPYDPDRLTQVGRALRQLGIEHILAYSPQARGRSERVNRTLQDRLVNELRVGGVRTVDAANAYLEQRFRPHYNRSFGRPPRESASAFVPVGRVDLEQILCHQEERRAGQDNTVTLEGVRLQIPKQPGRRTCAGLRVLVRRHLDSTYSIWSGPRCLGRYDAGGQPRRSRPVDAAGPRNAKPRVPRDLGCRLNTAGIHSAHKAAATTP